MPPNDVYDSSKIKVLKGLDAVQSAGDLVGAVVELPARVQDGHDHFGCRSTLFRVDVHRNAAAVIRHGHGLVGMDRDDDAVAIPG